MTRTSALIIGGGLAGLATAIRLRRAGHAVTLLERNERPGGKAGEYRRDGFRFDTGPTLLTLPGIVDELFAAAGRDRRELLDLCPLDILCRYHFPDGSHLEASSNPVEFIDAVRDFSPGDVDALRRYFRHVAALFSVSDRVFLRDRFQLTQLWRRLRLRDLPDARKFLTFSTLHRLHERRFRDPRLTMVFDRFATYNGSNPWKTPATFAVISHVEFAGGAWYPVGGIAALAESLIRLAHDLGIDIRTGCTVERLIIRDRRVLGAVTADGGEWRAGVTVANADAVTVFESMLQDVPSLRRLRAQLLTREASSSGFIIHAGVRRAFPSLRHHNIFFSPDYQQEFRSIFLDSVAPDPATIYLAASCKTQATDAPPGMENWFVMVNVPPLSRDSDWDGMKDDLASTILSRLGRLIGVRDSDLAFAHVVTPQTFARHFLAWRGALYGHASHSIASAFQRPPMWLRSLAGLYFTGGSTHPGGGIPLVLLSADIVARRIMRDVPV